MSQTISLSPLRLYRKAVGMSQADLAEKLKLEGTGTISKWENGRIPAERVLDVERITGIPRHRLRPDIYPEEKASA